MIKADLLAALGRGRCKGLPPGQFARLAIYATLISQGVREAYLVDGMSLDGPGAVLALSKICSGLELEIAVVRLGEDNLVLILASVLLGKIVALSHPQGFASPPARFPLYVSVDQAPSLPSSNSPRLLTEDEMQRIWGCLSTATETLGKALRDTSGSRPQCVKAHGFDDLESVERVVGLSFVAGWLLGYPCVYHSVASDSLGGNLLSMQRLRKYSVTANLACDLGRLGSKVTIDLSEFSVPLCLLEPLSLDKALANLLAERVRALESRVQEIGSQHCIIGAVSVESQDFQLPHVMI